MSKNSVHNVQGCLGTTNGRFVDREENDFYATQPIATEHLLKIEKLDKNIWECACGQGHMAKVLVAHGYNVKATDLIDRGYGAGGVNFLECTEIFDGDIVTNPPFKYAQEFVEHALKLVAPGHKVCMFLKLQFLEGKRRRQLFDNHPPIRVHVSTSRIQCGKNAVFSGSMVAYAWYVWEKDYQGKTTLMWFN